MDKFEQVPANTSLLGNALTTPTASTHSQGRDLQWLPGLGPTYDGKVRAFVLRSHMLKRRQAAQSSKVKQRASRHHQSQDGNDEEPQPQQTSPNLYPKTSGNADLALYPRSSVNDCPSQSRADPFVCLAWTFNANDWLLINHYIGDAMFELYGLQRRTCFHPPRNLLFKHFLEDDCALGAVLTWSATNLQVLHDSERFMRLASKYRAMTIRKISTRISQRPQSITDLPISAIIGLISNTVEARSGGAEEHEVDEMWAHIRGLRALVTYGGGWDCVTASGKDISWCLQWTDVVLSGALSMGFTSASQHLYSWPSIMCTSDTPGQQIVSTARLAVEELIGAYGDFYHLALERAGGKIPCTTLETLFDKQSYVYGLLTTRQGISLDPIGPTIYINIMLWQVRRDTPEQLRALRHSLEDNFRKTDVDLQCGIELLFWGLSIDIDTKVFLYPSWVQILGRLLNVHFRLKPATRAKLATVLLGFVFGDEDVDWWPPMVFRDIVYADLDLFELDPPQDVVWNHSCN